MAEVESINGNPIVAEVASESIQPSVDAWLAAHPEATTTVQDGAVSTAKLANGAVTDAKLAQTGGVLDAVDLINGMIVDAGIGFNVNDFDTGNISIDYTGWTYSDFEYRVRTKPNTTITLNAGDVVGLRDYSDARYYLGWRDAGGSYHKQGWLTQDYTLPTSGECVILMAHITGTIPASKYDLLDLLFINRTTVVEEPRKSIYELPFWNNGKMRIHAHAGLEASGAPSNSIPAFENAGKRGAFICETDARITSDGHIVCIHNATVDSTTDGTGTVKNMTLEQIRALSLYGGTGLKVPTLEEFLLVCKKYNMMAAIEDKDHDEAGYYAAIMDTVEQCGMQSQIMFITSYIPARLPTIRQLTEAPCMLICNDSAWEVSLSAARSYDYVGITYDNTNSITAEKIETCHNDMIPFDTFTVSSTAVADSYFSMGVDMITTDNLSASDWS